MTTACPNVLRRVPGVFLAVALAILIADPGMAEAAGKRRSSRTAPSSSSKLTLAKVRASGARTGSTRTRRGAAAAARALREAKEPHFKFDESGALVPDIRAEAAIIYNPRTGDVLQCVEMPADAMVSGLESDGVDRFFCGGGGSGKIRVVQRPE